MTEAELLALRTVLADRRCILLDQLAVALLDRLTIAGEDGNLPVGQIVEPGFLPAGRHPHRYRGRRCRAR